MIRILCTITWLALGASTTLAGVDEDAVGNVLKATFDRPDSRLVVDPVVIVGSYAIAGWTQGDMGGRALLKLRDTKWSLILCSGDGIKSAPALQQAGLSAAEASAMSAKLGHAETSLTKERLALFARFEGTTMMNVDGEDPHRK